MIEKLKLKNTEHPVDIIDFLIRKRLPDRDL